MFKWLKQRTVIDVTQSCACCDQARTLTAKSVARGRPCCCRATGLWPLGGNGSQVFPASMLTVLRRISLTVALAAGSARAAGLDANNNNNNNTHLV